MPDPSLEEVKSKKQYSGIRVRWAEGLGHLLAQLWVCMCGSYLLSPRHAVGGHVKDTVHALEGLVQGFFISDISLKQK